MQISPSKSRDLADENNKVLTEWRQISIKLFYLYHRLQCRNNYFFKIKFVFFLYLRLSASSKENDLPLCIYFWYQTDSVVPNTSIYSGRNWDVRWHLNSWFWYLEMISQVINVFYYALNLTAWLNQRKPTKLVFNHDLPLCIYFWYQTDSVVPNTSI
jgi:hypothetical protein